MIVKRVYKGLTVLLSVAISIGTAKDSGAVGASKGLFGFQRGVMVASRSQLGRPA